MAGRTYTRGGDDGTSSFGDGSRLPKSHPLFEALGAIDEANSFIGLARSAVSDTVLDRTLHFAQQRLLNCGSRLAAPEGSDGADGPTATAEDVRVLEGEIDRLEDAGGGFDGFVVPVGSETAARLHVARTVVRRAERRIVSAAEAGARVDETVRTFLNRLSDLLYVAARWTAQDEGWHEEDWDPQAPGP